MWCLTGIWIGVRCSIVLPPNKLSSTLPCFPNCCLSSAARRRSSAPNENILYFGIDWRCLEYKLRRESSLLCFQRVKIDSGWSIAKRCIDRMVEPVTSESWFCCTSNVREGVTYICSCSAFSLFSSCSEGSSSIFM